MVSKGMISGVVATVALSAMMLMKSAMGVMPAFDIISDWTNVLATFGVAISPAIAWFLHFALVGRLGNKVMLSEFVSRDDKAFPRRRTGVLRGGTT